MNPAAPVSVTVEGGARLHFGFTDPEGHFGRRFGSIGLAIREPSYRIHFKRISRGTDGCEHKVLPATDPVAHRVHGFLQKYLTAHDIDFDVVAHVERALNSHAGLGSGTQLAVASGVAANALAGRSFDPYRIADFLGRGTRSAIGAAAFDTGGFIVDGGRSEKNTMPPIIVRRIFPPEWAIVLVSDATAQGLSADTELAAFSDLPEFSERASGEICRLLLLRVLPAIEQKDLFSFAEGISRIQEITGDYFAPHQGGHRFTSLRVEKVLDWMARHGAFGKGQSSWGPTGYVFCESASRANKLVADLKRLRPDDGLLYCVTTGRNFGSTIERSSASAPGLTLSTASC